MTKDDKQNIQELSPDLLDRYIRKATKSSVKLWKKSDSEEDKVMSTDGNKYPDKQNRHFELAEKYAKKAIKRDNGVMQAATKTRRIGEEIPQEENDENILSELSIKTLKSYQTKGQFDPKRVKGFYKAENQIKDKKNPVDEPKVHDLTHYDDDGDVYDHTQVNSDINDGDILKLRGGRTALMYSAWPTMISGKSDALHHLKPGGKFQSPRYNKSLDLEKKVSSGNLKEEVVSIEKNTDLISKLINKFIK